MRRSSNQFKLKHSMTYHLMLYHICIYFYPTNTSKQNTSFFNSSVCTNFMFPAFFPPNKYLKPNLPAQPVTNEQSVRLLSLLMLFCSATYSCFSDLSNMDMQSIPTSQRPHQSNLAKFVSGIEAGQRAKIETHVLTLSNQEACLLQRTCDGIRKY